MSTYDRQPWASGPAEILQHAVDLLASDSDTKRRLAMILCDNAVEQMIKTFLNLPKRINHLSISRKKRDEISDSFPSLLDALEEFASDKLGDVDLGAIEWYHRLRNELYHQGFGLTVERRQVEVYAELANVLYKNLFGTDLLNTPIAKGTDRLGEFLALWTELERELVDMASDHQLASRPIRRLIDAVAFLERSNLLSKEDANQIQMLRDVRNQVVHGMLDYDAALDESVMESIKHYSKLFKDSDS